MSFLFSLWNNLSTLSCLNISTFSKNGMLIDVTHKLGYHSSNLISKKKKKSKPTGFPVFSAHLEGIKKSVLVIFPWSMYPRRWAPSICSSADCPDHKAYSSFSPGALKQHAQLLPKEALSLPHPSHWGNTQTQPFLVSLYKNTRARLTQPKAEAHPLDATLCPVFSKSMAYAGQRGNKYNLSFNNRDTLQRIPFENSNALGKV